MKKAILAKATSFRQKILFALIAFAIVPALIVGIVGAQIAEHNIITMKTNEYSDQFMNIRNNINRIINDIDKLTLEMYIDDALQDELSNTPEEIDEILFYNNLRQLCARRIVDDSRLSMIGIYGNRGLTYVSQPSLRDMFDDAEAVQSYLRGNNIDTLSSWVFIPSIESPSGADYSLVNIKTVRDIDTLESYGYMVSVLSDEFFSSALPGHVSCDALAMVDDNGEMVLSTGDTKIAARVVQSDGVFDGKHSSDVRMIDNQKYLISNSFIPNLNASLVCVVNYDNLIAPAREITTVMFIILAVSLAVAIIAATAVSRSMLRPVNYLSGVIEKVTQGDLEAKFQPTGTDEVNMLGESFNQMVDSLNTNIETIKQMMVVKQESDRQLLQAQINPHLIYNSLNSLKELVRHEDSETLIQAIDQLSKFYRKSLTYGESVISIGDELEHVDAYIKVQNICFGKSIDLQVGLSDETKDNVIVKMTLQPIVENALLHGLAAYELDGIIAIFEETCGNDIVLCVKDSGVGIAETELKNLNDILLSDKEVVKDAYGLTNINSRIKYCFGHNYGISIESELLSFTCIKIKLPRQLIGAQRI